MPAAISPTTSGIPSHASQLPERRARTASITASESRKTRLSCSVMRPFRPRSREPPRPCNAKAACDGAVRDSPSPCGAWSSPRSAWRSTASSSPRSSRSSRSGRRSFARARAKGDRKAHRRRVDRRPPRPLPLRHAVRHHAREPRASAGSASPRWRAVLDRAVLSRHGGPRRARPCTSRSTCSRSPSSRSATSCSASSCPSSSPSSARRGRRSRPRIPLRVIYFTFFPLLWLLERSSRLILRAVGLSPDVASVEGRFSEDEILAILAASAARSPRGRGARRALRARHALLAARGAPLDGAARRRGVAAHPDDGRGRRSASCARTSTRASS